MRSSLLGVALILLGAMPIGCARSDRPTLYPVTGTVTFDSKPLPDASVTFMPESGLVALGRTDNSGTFKLMTQGTEGATPGVFRVVITAMESGPKLSAEEWDKLTDAERRKRAKSVIPPRYGDMNASEMSATVTEAGPNQFTFALER